ncbi:MAG: DNA/RNA non-specific endonuclease [Bacilli bacterium]|nr:DNA/RNA non-specific endonuclease [Bacilli bacterium]
MLKLFVCLILSIACFGADASYFYNKGYIPVVNSGLNTVELTYEDFDVVYSTKYKIPLWSAEFLNGNFVHDKRINSFHEETKLDTQFRSKLEDYKGSNYDKGHMSPYADMKTRNAEFESFTLANMIPQEGDCNRGKWAEMEDYVRNISKTQPIYVITGPIIGNSSKFINKNVLVPVAMFKIVYLTKTNEASAYVMQNDNTCSYKIVNINEVEKETGISFFENINKDKVIDLPRLTKE